MSSSSLLFDRRGVAAPRVAVVGVWVRLAVPMAEARRLIAGEAGNRGLGAAELALDGMMLVRRPVAGPTVPVVLMAGGLVRVVARIVPVGPAAGEGGTSMLEVLETERFGVAGMGVVRGTPCPGRAGVVDLLAMREEPELAGSVLVRGWRQLHAASPPPIIGGV